MYESLPCEPSQIKMSLIWGEYADKRMLSLKSAKVMVSIYFSQISNVERSFITWNQDVGFVCDKVSHMYNGQIKFMKLMSENMLQMYNSEKALIWSQVEEIYEDFPEMTRSLTRLDLLGLDGLRDVKMQVGQKFPKSLLR